MGVKHILEHEHKSIKRGERLQLLPNRYKRMAIISALVLFVSLLTVKFFLGDFETTQLIIKNLLLISLLLISISSDRIEDERSSKLRSQSYAYAFVVGVIYALVQPFADLLVDAVLHTETPTFTELSVSQVLFVMLFVQVAYFHFIKRMQ